MNRGRSASLLSGNLEGVEKGCSDNEPQSSTMNGSTIKSKCWPRPGCGSGTTSMTAGSANCIYRCLDVNYDSAECTLYIVQR